MRCYDAEHDPDDCLHLMGYLIPAAYTGISTRLAHTRRVPPSSEPGTDYYMPRGTVLRAPAACTVVAVAGGIVPATGRYVTVDDGTRWIRYLHLLRQDVRVGDRLEAGQAFGLSGASGYGSEHFGAASDSDPAMIRRTGGPHVHVTAFKGRGYTFGNSGTIDFHALTGGAVAGGGSTTPEDDMTQADVDEIKLAVGQIRDVLGAQNGLNAPTDMSVLANLRAVAAMDANILLIAQNLAAYIYAGGPGVDQTLGAPNSMFGMLLGLTGRPEPGAIDVDEQALAESLAPMLSAFSDADVARFAKAAADEADRRERLRLEVPTPPEPLA